MADDDWKRNYRNIYNNLKNYFSSVFVDIDDVGKNIITTREVKRLSPKHLILAYLIVSEEGITSLPLETDLMDNNKYYGGRSFEDWLNILFNVEDDKRLSFFHKLRVLAYIYRIIGTGEEGMVEEIEEEEVEIEIEEEEGYDDFEFAGEDEEEY